VTKLRRIGWIKDSIVGAEFAEVRLEANRLTARSVAIGDDPLPYRVDFELETGRAFRTERLRLDASGDGWSRSLVLLRDGEGHWLAETGTEGDAELPAPGGDMALVDGALDCDIAHSPVTNSMPVLRHDLLARPGSHDFLMAWVSLPDLAVRPSRQRYVSAADVAATGVVRYVSLDGTFEADLTFDPDGLVIDYPELGRRIGGAPST
jgi:hypothetical protein